MASVYYIVHLWILRQCKQKKDQSNNVSFQGTNVNQTNHHEISAEKHLPRIPSLPGKTNKIQRLVEVVTCTRPGWGDL